MNIKFSERRKSSALAKIQASRYWWDGDWFRAADISPMLKMKTKVVGVLLSELVDEGIVQCRLNSHGNIYRRPKPSQLCVKWRHDESVYNDIEQERYEMLVAECEAMT